MANENISFSLELAQEYTSSTEQFPINFELAWQWIGYAKKQNGKDKLVKNFEKGIDYIITQVRVNPAQQGIQEGGRPSEQINLTIDAFKSLAMMAGTEKGKEVRKYFLQCEKVAKEKREKIFPFIHNQNISSHYIEEKGLIDQALFVIDRAYQDVPLRYELVAQIKLQTAASINPALKPHLTIAQKVLEAQTATDFQLLTATEIGKRLGISARAANKLLIEKGFQIPNPRKKSSKDASYVPTDRGNEFADFTQSADGKGNTFQQLRWFESVVDALG